jgi:hypothetical protein
MLGMSMHPDRQAEQPRYRPDGYVARKIKDLQPGTLAVVFPANPNHTPFDAKVLEINETAQEGNPQVVIETRTGGFSLNQDVPSGVIISVGGGTTAARYGSSGIDEVDQKRLAHKVFSSGSRSIQADRRHANEMRRLAFASGQIPPHTS